VAPAGRQRLRPLQPRRTRAVDPHRRLPAKRRAAPQGLADSARRDPRIRTL